MKTKNIIIFLSATFIYNLIFIFFYSWMRYGSPFADFTVLEFALSIGINYIPIVAIGLVNYLIIFHNPINHHIAVKILLEMIASMIGLSVINGLFMLVTGWSVDWAGTVFNALMLLMFFEMLFYFQKFQRSREREAMIKQENLNYKYEVLKAQVNPHFLFNSLNILYSLISIDADKSKDFVVELSAMYRYILNQENKNEILLDSEMQFIDSYIKILKMRYCNQFDVEIIATGNHSNARIIPFTMQLLIENVIKHNEISDLHPMLISIELGESEVRISNTIVPRKAGSETHLGLKYITQLYALRNKQFVFEHNEKNFTAIVPYL